MQNQISVQHYVAAFGKRVILKDVSFSIPSGQLTVVLGENGAGKTTLIKAILNAYLQPKSAADEVNGIEVSTKKLAYVPQFRDLGSDYPLSLAAFVGLAIRQKGWPFLTKKEKGRVQEALALVDLTDLKDLPLSKASGGQKQRAYIAQALAQNPDLLILDEPTAALDAKHSQEVVSQIRNAQQKKGMGVLWISHDTSWVKDFSDNYLWLHDGQAEFGSVDSLPDAARSIHQEEVNDVN
ncbi:ATP-binding cassette domain-containing protein [Fructobacillus sp. M2-14]|uniref:ATP-binding cassette domain-containing protein n=1 Tax=Fructobacillus broussonetiae TaxID=2713173 RepID=A0ABS5R2P7_9LACO|nr:ATP-binding cassette domain-containing protein [Fructobacillus broussonetiae]MBS9338834.1 ATP-binding cassette domain-containing protein [Fructobacillus broussonetiae]